LSIYKLALSDQTQVPLQLGVTEGCFIYIYIYIPHQYKARVKIFSRFILGAEARLFFSPEPEPTVNVPVNMHFSVMLVLQYLELYMLLFVVLELPQAKKNLLMGALFRLFWRRVELFYYALILYCRGYRNEL